LAKPKGRKLKVFQAQFGFYDTVVAAPSQAAALRAWGTRQNLFASGDAKVVTDEAAVAAATAQPETPLRRAIGSTDPFVLEEPELRYIVVSRDLNQRPLCIRLSIGFFSESLCRLRLRRCGSWLFCPEAAPKTRLLCQLRFGAPKLYRPHPVK
jgi:hypothetical protein